MKKNKSKIIIGILLGIFIISIIINGAITNSKPATKEVLIEIKYDDYMKIANSDKESYVFVGSPTCPYCIASKPIIEQVFSEANIKIYYLNTANTSQESLANLVEKTEGVFKGSVPHLLVFKNGKLQRELLGKRSYEEYKALIK